MVQQAHAQWILYVYGNHPVWHTQSAFVNNKSNSLQQMPGSSSVVHTLAHLCVKKSDNKNGDDVQTNYGGGGGGNNNSSRSIHFVRGDRLLNSHDPFVNLPPECLFPECTFSVYDVNETLLRYFTPSEILYLIIFTLHFANHVAHSQRTELFMKIVFVFFFSSTSFLLRFKFLFQLSLIFLLFCRSVYLQLSYLQLLHHLVLL